MEGYPMAIELTDDGTMDTVLRCSECGEEFRFNYSSMDDADDDLRADRILALIDANPGISTERATELLDETMYDEWVDECIAETEADHECSADDDDSPDEDSITTSDHQTFYQYGSPCLRAITDSTGEYWEAHRNHGSRDATWMQLGRFASVEQAVKAYLLLEQFYPSVFFISDHGNPIRIDLSEEK